MASLALGEVAGECCGEEGEEFNFGEASFVVVVGEEASVTILRTGFFDVVESATVCLREDFLGARVRDESGGEDVGLLREFFFGALPETELDGEVLKLVAFVRKLLKRERLVLSPSQENSSQSALAASRE